MSYAGMQTQVYDVAVVGAGPAGSSAAHAAARAGAKTIVIDRDAFPRYKTCGGGLIGPTLRSLPPEIAVPVRQEIYAVTFSHCGGAQKTWKSDKRALSLVDRADFDKALLDAAVSEGATARLETLVTSVSEEKGCVRLGTDQGSIRAKYVVGADGSASRVARFVGVECGQVDLGLELELDASGLMDDWLGRIHLDWGPLPGSYAWVFPKRETLTVGVIAHKRNARELKTYLQNFLAQQGLERATVIRSSGHLTRCRSRDSPLGRGRVVVCGDAAGLLEPWTREGISFAIRSGSIAGRILASAVRGDDIRSTDNAVDVYAAEIGRSLVSEMEAGAYFLAAFERHTGLMHGIFARSTLGWEAFQRIARGDTTLARVLRHRSARAIIRLLSVV